jgi:hypothetical protein
MPKRPSKPESAPKKKPPRLVKRTPEEAVELIKKHYKRVENHLHNEYDSKIATDQVPFVTEIATHKYQDDSATADLRITGIRSNLEINDILISIHEKLDLTGVNGAWMSIGFLFPPSGPDAADENYKRFQGQIFLRSNSQRWTKANTVRILSIAGHNQKTFVEKYNRRPFGLIIRSWWNPFGNRPRVVDAAKATRKRAKPSKSKGKKR